MERYGEAGWEWTERHDVDGQVHEWRYRTDGDGEGLWSWSDTSGWRQGRGHLQYKLPFSEANARRMIASRYRNRAAELDGPDDAEVLRSLGMAEEAS